MNKNKLHLVSLITGIFVMTTILPFTSCAKEEKAMEQQSTQDAVKPIQGFEKLNEVLESSGDDLLMLDLYADWCGPCRMLAPILEEIAKENRDKVKVYKINIDKNPDIARSYGVSGIPFVVLVKNKIRVHAFTGLQSKQAYVRVIDRFSEITEEPSFIKPDGEIVNGERIIRLSPASSPGIIYVYRGEMVNLNIEKIDFPYSIHIPEFGISKEGTVGQDLKVTFEARKIGIFPIFCNGKCPTGDGARYGQIAVMQYEAAGDAEFTELTVNEGVDLIRSSDPLILDVRTPNEYYAGHIKNSKLIPLQQLEGRMSEIGKYKNKPILVYCRFGNRSTVASEIMIRNGFKKLYNLRQGVIGWQKAGEQLEK